MFHLYDKLVNKDKENEEEEEVMYGRLFFHLHVLEKFSYLI